MSLAPGRFGGAAPRLSPARSSPAASGGAEAGPRVALPLSPSLSYPALHSCSTKPCRWAPGFAAGHRPPEIDPPSMGSDLRVLGSAGGYSSTSAMAAIPPLEGRGCGLGAAASPTAVSAPLRRPPGVDLLRARGFSPATACGRSGLGGAALGRGLGVGRLPSSLGPGRCPPPLMAASPQGGSLLVVPPSAGTAVC